MANLKIDDIFDFDLTLLLNFVVFLALKIFLLNFLIEKCHSFIYCMALKVLNLKEK